MIEDISEMQRLLKEAAEELRQGDSTSRRNAVKKLERVSALAATLALMLQVRYS
jgi:hypothetical protein